MCKHINSCDATRMDRTWTFCGLACCSARSSCCFHDKSPVISFCGFCLPELDRLTTGIDRKSPGRGMISCFPEPPPLLAAAGSEWHGGHSVGMSELVCGLACEFTEAAAAAE